MQKQDQRPPVLFCFDEQPEACSQQIQRKDSTSSEVAALLHISGRTSRISSVGSQGSAVSRLSAISGISRTPSPHKMILETSFCGPKPINSELVTSNAEESIMAGELEQVVLARKHDLTKAIFAEGIQIDTSTPTRIHKDKKCVTNGDTKIENITSVIIAPKMLAGCSGPRSLGTKKGSTGVSRKTEPTIVGVTPEGTQYIRIKLKPDHMYNDRGIAVNERVVNETEAAKKPASLSLSRDQAKKTVPHFSQFVQANIGETGSTEMKPSEHLVPNLSPKHLHHSTPYVSGSRSPSPATMSASRKSSFCSLFRMKESVASPESPTTDGQHNKSVMSIALDSPHDRSRSKSRESDRSSSVGGDPSTNNTPSKQRSILALFKPKRSSKSSSPTELASVETLKTIRTSTTTISSSSKRDSNPHPQQIASEKPRLKYYETPSDGVSIYIPLHTPPEEKDNASSFSVKTATKPLSAFSTTRSQTTVNESVVSTQDLIIAKVKHSGVVDIPKDRENRPSSAPVNSLLPKSQMLRKYRIELPDGSIRIPLRTPSDERTENDPAADSTICETMQRDNTQEIQNTIVASQNPSLDSTALSSKSKCAVEKKVIVEVNILSEPKICKQIGTSAIGPTPEPEPVTNQSSQEEVTASGAAVGCALRAMATKERKRILFSTKIGSGSEEQIFATQLSLSKTESLSSQLSEQVSCNSESPLANGSDEKKRTESETIFKTRKDDYSETQKCHRELVSMNTNRHSMYIENIEEILKLQHRIEHEQQSSLCSDERMIVVDESGSAHEPIMEGQTTSILSAASALQAKPPEKPGRPSKASPFLRRCNSERVEEKIDISSESEHESESDTRHRLTRLVGNVEEESAGLVAQDSYDEEFPYIPTTLPEERTLGIIIVPVRDRALMDVRTCPVDRPRSTTPLNPSFLEEYCGTVALTEDMIEAPMRGEKLRINLPRKDLVGNQRSKSPRRVSNTSGKSWFEFAVGQTMCSPSNSISSSGIVSCSERKGSELCASEWIDFDNIPEKRKPAKRITTLPQKDSPKELANVQYNYVNPEECQCDCHGNERESGNNTDSDRKESIADDQSPDDCVPLLDSDYDEAATTGSNR